MAKDLELALIIAANDNTGNAPGKTRAGIEQVKHMNEMLSVDSAVSDTASQGGAAR